jgi:CubicO group peptidase (beta-lactamase class C family)
VTVATKIDPGVLSEEGLRTLIEPELKRFGVPAVEVAVVRDNEVVFTGGFGLRDVERSLPVTPGTVFHHGSTGKAFTGLLVAALVDDGVLAWDRPVREYVPEFRMPDPALSDRVTIRDLLSHRSGLGRQDMMWIANPSWSAGELMGRIPHLTMAAEFRSEFSYCNLGYAVIGEIIARVAGASWTGLVHQRILEPLLMKRAVTSADEMQALEDHAEPYLGHHDGLARTIYRDITSTAPAGQLMYCAEDSARWLRFQAGGGELDGVRVASKEAFEQTRSIQIPVDYPGFLPDQLDWGPRFQGYGMGWMVATYRDRPIMWHSGGIDGFYTEILILTEDRAGVLASTNAHLSPLSTAVVMSVADLLLGAEVRPWFERVEVLQQQAHEQAEKERSELAVVPGTAPSHPLEEFGGRYEHRGWGSLEVGIGEGSDLAVRLGKLDCTASYRHFDTWTGRYEPLDVTFPLTFVTNAEGVVTEVRAEIDPGSPVTFTRSEGGAE